MKLEYLLKNILIKVAIAHGSSTGTVLVHSKGRNIKSVFPELSPRVGKARHSVEI